MVFLTDGGVSAITTCSKYQGRLCSHIQVFFKFILIIFLIEFWIFFVLVLVLSVKAFYCEKLKKEFSAPVTINLFIKRL